MKFLTIVSGTNSRFEGQTYTSLHLCPQNWRLGLPTKLSWRLLYGILVGRMGGECCWDSLPQIIDNMMFFVMVLIFRFGGW